MADIKKIKVGEESYDIAASKLEGDIVADYGSAPSVSFNANDVDIRSVDASVNISGDLNTNSTIRAGWEIYADGDIYAQSYKKVATEEWVTNNVSNISYENTPIISTKYVQGPYNLDEKYILIGSGINSKGLTNLEANGEPDPDKTIVYLPMYFSVRGQLQSGEYSFVSELYRYESIFSDDNGYETITTHHFSGDSIKIGSQTVATQEWVTAQIQAALNNN